MMEMKNGLKKLGYVVPTVISLGGYALVRSGIEDGITTRKGLAKVFTGRLCDLLDGFIARKMGWSTTFGKIVDFTLDKKATQEIHDAVVAAGIEPKIYSDATVRQEATITAANGLTRVLHPRRTMGRSPEGAYAMAGKGLNMGGYMLAELIREDQPELAAGIRAASHVIGAVGIFHYGEQASRGYIQNIR
jgi:hypothetical protein